METETEPQPGGEPEPEPADDAGPGGEPEGGAEPPPAGQPPSGEEVRLAKRAATAEKRQAFRDRITLEKLLKEQQRQNAELSRRLDQSLGRMTDVVERSTPPREDPFIAKKKALDVRWEKVVARLDKDPSAAEEFRELQMEYGSLGAEREYTRRQADAPRPPNPLAQTLFVEFPWLHPEHGDPEARAMVNGETAKLVRKEKRDMSNPQVQFHTLRQAAALVAKEIGYPIPMGYEGNGASNGRERVANTGGRSGGGGGGDGADPFVGRESDIEAAATILYPQLDKPAAIAKWKATVGKRYMQPQK